MSDSQTQLVPSDRGQNAPLLRELAGIHDIPLRVCIEVGRLRLAVGEFLRLAEGTIIEIKKPAGEPFEISLNGCVVGKGEIIMVEQSSGVRIVEVLKPAGLA
jgi:flagellar motor switch protein FliN/FliY